MVQAVDEKLMREWSMSEVHKVLCELKPRERDILRLRYMTSDNKKRTLEECGMLFGVTKERIRQIEQKAIRKIIKKFSNIINDIEF